MGNCCGKESRYGRGGVRPGLSPLSKTAGRKPLLSSRTVELPSAPNARLGSEKTQTWTSSTQSLSRMPEHIRSFTPKKIEAFNFAAIPVHTPKPQPLPPGFGREQSIYLPVGPQPAQLHVPVPAALPQATSIYIPPEVRPAQAPPANQSIYIPREPVVPQGVYMVPPIGAPAVPFTGAARPTPEETSGDSGGDSGESGSAPGETEDLGALQNVPSTRLPQDRSAKPKLRKRRSNRSSSRSPTRDTTSKDPDNKAPVTLAPQTFAPQTLAPQTLAPQTLALQTLAPQTLAAKTKTRPVGGGVSLAVPQLDLKPASGPRGKASTKSAPDSASKTKAAPATSLTKAAPATSLTKAAPATSLAKAAPAPASVEAKALSLSAKHGSVSRPGSLGKPPSLARASARATAAPAAKPTSLTKPSSVAKARPTSSNGPAPPTDTKYENEGPATKGRKNSSSGSAPPPPTNDEEAATVRKLKEPSNTSLSA